MLQEIQIAIVLQAFLKIVIGQQRVQVARLRRVGQRLELPEPAVARILVRAQQVLEHVAVVDARDRGVEIVGLAGKGLQGGLVVLGRLRRGVQLAVGVGHREVRLLHGGVQQAALVQLEPRHQRRAVVAQRRMRPAIAEQRAARIRAVEAHALQRHARLRRLVRLQIGETERQVGLVAHRQQLVAVGLQRADRRQDRIGLRQPAGAHQCHAEIEARIGHPVGRALPALQSRDGFIVALLAHQHIDQQMRALGFQLRRQLALDAVQRLLAAIEVAALVPDLAKIEPGFVAHARWNVVAEQRLEARSGLVVHAELQIQARRPAAAHRPHGAACAASGCRLRAASRPAGPNPRRPSSETARRRSADPAPGCWAACPDRPCARPMRRQPAASSAKTSPSGSAARCHARAIPSP